MASNLPTLLDVDFLETLSVPTIGKIYRFVTIGGNKNRKDLLNALTKHQQSNTKSTITKNRKKSEYISKISQCPNITINYINKFIHNPSKLANQAFLDNLNNHIITKQRAKHRTISTPNELYPELLCYGYCHSYDMMIEAIAGLISKYYFMANVVVILELDDNLFPTTYYEAGNTAFIDLVIDKAEKLLFASSGFSVYVVTKAETVWIQHLYAKYPKLKEIFTKYVQKVISAYDINSGEYPEQIVKMKYDIFGRIINKKTINKFISICDQDIDAVAAARIISDLEITDKSTIIKVGQSPNIQDMIHHLTFITEMIEKNNYKSRFIYNFGQHPIDSYKMQQQLVEKYGTTLFYLQQNDFNGLLIEAINGMWSRNNISKLIKSKSKEMKYKINNMLRPGVDIQCDGEAFVIKRIIKNIDTKKGQKEEKFNGKLLVVDNQRTLVEIDMNDREIFVLKQYEIYIDYLCYLLVQCEFCGKGFIDLNSKGNHMNGIHERLKI